MRLKHLSESWSSMRKSVKVSNITCAQCAKTIEHHFNEKKDMNARVLVNAKTVIFNYDDQVYTQEDLYTGLQQIGYYPIYDNETQKKAKKRDLIDLIVGTLFTLPLLWTMFVHLNVPLYTPDFLMNGYVQMALTIPVMFFAGRRFFIQAYHQIRSKTAGMDVLVVIGTMAAFIYSLYSTINHSIVHGNHGHPNLYFETSAVIVYMVLLGNYFENRVKEKTSDSLQSLMSLGAKEARVVKENEILVIPLEQVKVDNIVLVLANEKVPVDGIIIDGNSYFDEAMITGESMPAFKDVGGKVVGSTINIMHTVKVKVTATGNDTVLSQIIQTVEETALIKPKAQRVADLIASYFVPVVVVLSILVFILQWAINKEISFAFETAVAVLAISCPCALGLATPTSISVGSGIAFRKGILYKGGEFFEKAHQINAIAFDKTGTLTIGSPEVVNFYGNKDSLIYTKSLEAHSNHPLAQAIINFGQSSTEDVSDFEVLMGLGIHGKVLDKNVYVGSFKVLTQLNVNHDYIAAYEKHSKEGKTVIFTVVDNIVVNMIAIIDPIKDDAKNLINHLKSRGIKPYMITGDQKDTAQYIAGQLGINDVYAEVLPHEKSDVIKEIQNKGNVVAFVGDGINDAPALKMADVGFVVSTGADIALDSADVALMKPDLSLVLHAIDLSKATLKNIYLNFFWAFIYNIVMIPFAALGFITPSLAGIGMGFSSLMVVLNALSLNLFRFKKLEGGSIDESNRS